MWAQLGLNQRPPDYESGATNQLSYGSVLFRSLPRCRGAVFRTGAQKYINSVEMQKKAGVFFGRRTTAKSAGRSSCGRKARAYPFRQWAGKAVSRVGIGSVKFKKSS